MNTSENIWWAMKYPINTTPSVNSSSRGFERFPAKAENNQMSLTATTKGNKKINGSYRNQMITRLVSRGDSHLYSYCTITVLLYMFPEKTSLRH